MNTQKFRRLVASGITAGLASFALVGITAFATPAAQASTEGGTVQVADSAPAFVFEGPIDDFGGPLPGAVVGEEFRVVIGVQGTPTPAVEVIDPTFDIFRAGLPAGLELTAGEEPGTVVISGIPQDEGLYLFRLQATNAAGQTTTEDLLLLVQPGLPWL